MSRLELPNGDWADFDTRLNYAQARRVREANGTVDAQGVFVAAMVRAWALRDTDGNAIEFPGRDVDGIPIEAIYRIPLDTFAEMAAHAAGELEGLPDPKGTSGTSTSSRPGGRSASRRTSQRPTSSNGIQDGATPTFRPPPPT